MMRTVACLPSGRVQSIPTRMCREGRWFESSSAHVIRRDPDFFFCEKQANAVLTG